MRASEILESLDLPHNLLRRIRRRLLWCRVHAMVPRLRPTAIYEARGSSSVFQVIVRAFEPSNKMAQVDQYSRATCVSLLLAELLTPPHVAVHIRRLPFFQHHHHVASPRSLGHPPPARPPCLTIFSVSCRSLFVTWAILEVDSCPAYLRLRFELFDQMAVGTREMSERAAFRRVCVLWTGGAAGGGLGQF